MIQFLVRLRSSVAFQTPPIKPSQHGSVTQQVAGTTITVDYNLLYRARARSVWRASCRYDRVWCPGADECTTMTISTDVRIDGQALGGRDTASGARPGATKWTMIVNRAHPIFHTRYATVADQDVLTLDVTPKTGTHGIARVLLPHCRLSGTLSWCCTGERSSSRSIDVP
jgi:hypothetical protein